MPLAVLLAGAGASDNKAPNPRTNEGRASDGPDGTLTEQLMEVND